MNRTVLVTGGAGYVGSCLVPRLLDEGYDVRAIDLFLYGETLPFHERLQPIHADIRDTDELRSALRGCDSVIHLACISNDPSFELNPELGRSINLDAFTPLVELSRDAGVQRFIYASSSSVYGVKAVDNVTEDMPLEPLTDYSRYKAMCEDILAKYDAPDFATVTIRPATVCGYSPRQRLDVIVNILTNHAVHTGKIKVFGGDQKRPNLHMSDMVEVYALMMKLPAEKVRGRVYNVGADNHTVKQLAEQVRGVVGNGVSLETVPTDDNRSYHISSVRIFDELGFRPSKTIVDAVKDLVDAFDKGLLPNSMSDSSYFNIKRMQEVDLR